MNNLTLVEHSFIAITKDEPYSDEFFNVFIHQNSFEAIEKFILENSENSSFLIPSYNKIYGKTLKATKYVGVLQTKDGITIEILPKIAKSIDVDESREIFLKMLKSLKKSSFKTSNIANLLSKKMPLFEIFISMFCDELSKLIKKGIKSDYISQSENLYYLKGKLKVNEQIKRNYIHKEKFFVEYDEFNSNRVENRLIKSTLEFLMRASKSSKNINRLREYLFVFDECESSKNIDSDFKKIKIDRNLKHYELTLMWAKIFLTKESFTSFRGNSLAFALLFDMNRIFENYIANELKKIEPNISTQDTKYKVFSDNSGILQPDIVIRRNNEIIILDTKWKSIKEFKEVSTSDIYQMFIYGNMYQNEGVVKKIILLYPKIDEAKEESKIFNKLNIALEIKRVDLKDTKNSLEKILSE